MADKNESSGLTVKVDVDVSEAMKGLKALQREAKETTRVLKELEKASEHLQRIPTSKLNGITINMSDTKPTQEVVGEIMATLKQKIDREV